MNHVVFLNFYFGAKNVRNGNLACVESVSVRSERNSGHAKELFAFWPRENGATAKSWKEGGRGGERRERLPANPLILKNAH